MLDPTNVSVTYKEYIQYPVEYTYNKVYEAFWVTYLKIKHLDQNLQFIWHCGNQNLTF